MEEKNCIEELGVEVKIFLTDITHEMWTGLIWLYEVLQ